MISFFKNKFSPKPQVVELPPPTAYEDPTIPLPIPQQPPRSPLLDQIADRTKKFIPKVNLRNILPSRNERRPIRGETPSLEGFSYGRDSNEGVAVSPPPSAVSPPSGHADSPDMIGHRTPPNASPPPSIPRRPSPPSSESSSRDLPPLPSTTTQRSPLRESSQEDTPPPTIPSFISNRRSPPRESSFEEIPRPSIIPSTHRISPPRYSSLEETPPPTVLTPITNHNSPPTDSIQEESPSPTILPSTTKRPSPPRESSEENPPPTLPILPSIPVVPTTPSPPFAKIRSASRSSLVTSPVPILNPSPRKNPSPPRSDSPDSIPPAEVKTPVTPKPARRVQHFSLTEEIKKQPIPEVDELPRPVAMPRRQSSPPQDTTRVEQPITTVVRKISPAIRISDFAHQEKKEEEEPVKIDSPPVRESPDQVELEDYIKGAESDEEHLSAPVKQETVPRKQVTIRTAWESDSPPQTVSDLEKEVNRMESLAKEGLRDLPKPAERKPKSGQPPPSEDAPSPAQSTDRVIPLNTSPPAVDEKEITRELPKLATNKSAEKIEDKTLRRSSTIVYPNLHYFDEIGKEKETAETTKEVYVEERKSFRRTRRHVLEAAMRQASDDREAQGILETAALKSVTHAIAFQVALNLIALTLQGFLSGLAVAHAIFAYVFADRDLLLKGYRWMSLPVHATFMVCFILGIMASVDRVRWHEFSLRRIRTWINAFGGLLQLIPMLIGLTASEMSLYFDESLAPVISTPIIPPSSINTWRILSAIRAGCAVFSWISVAFQPTNTAILEHIGMFMLPEDAREAHDYYKEAGAANLVESRIPTVFGGVMDQVTKNMMKNMGVNSVPADMSVLLKNAAVLSSNPTDLPQSIPSP